MFYLTECEVVIGRTMLIRSFTYQNFTSSDHNQTTNISCSTKVKLWGGGLSSAPTLLSHTTYHSRETFQNIGGLEIHTKHVLRMIKGRITFHKSCTPLAKDPLFSRKIHEKSLKILLFSKNSLTLFWKSVWHTKITTIR